MAACSETVILSTIVSTLQTGPRSPPCGGVFIHRLESQRQVTSGTYAEVVSLGDTSDCVSLHQASRAWVLREAASR